MHNSRRCKHIISLCLGLFAWLHFVSGQEQLRFHRITSEDGLSQGVVNCILQDKRGFMWFGTQDGLNRYDGNSITIFKNNPIDSNSLAANNINCLFQDNKNRLWIGTDGGLSALNMYTGKYTNYFNVNSLHPGNNNIHSLYEDKEGTVWVGTEFNCLCRLDEKTNKFTTYQLPLKDTNSSAFDYISAITEDGAGKLWIGSFGGGLYSLDEKTNHIQNYYQDIDAHSKEAFVNNVSAIYFNAEKHELMIGTKGSGLEAFNLSDYKFNSYYHVSEDTIHTHEPKVIMSIVKDGEGDIWVGGNNGQGIFRFEEADRIYVSYKRHRSNNSNDVDDDFCNVIYPSADRILWIGTNNGVGYYLPAKRDFIVYRDTAHGRANVIMSIARDAGNKLWIGTNGGGLITYDESTHDYSVSEKLKQAINNISITALCIDNKDNLWIGTWGSGIVAYNLLSEKVFHIDSLNDAISKTTVTSILQDNLGKVWIGTYSKGVFIYDEKNQNIERVTVNNGLSDNRVNNLYEDPDNNIWISTDGGGVNCYASGGKIIVIKKTSGANTLSSNSVNCVYKDKIGNIWIGTGVGLNKYIPESKKFVHYFVKDGLPNDYIYSILADKQGNLWMTTDKGISKFNSSDTGKDETNAFRNYDESDGLPADEFNQGAFLQLNNGRIYYGSMNGLVSFLPEKVAGNSHEPPVSIISCLLFGKDFISDSLSLEKKYIELPWQKNNISFSFVGLDYEMPSKNKYKYILEGADADWSTPSTRRWASYAQLPPGHYVFRVKASNNDGVWSPVGAAIYINIVPPFWKTDWFYATCIILIIGGIYAFVKYRTARIVKEKKVLEAKVEERTYELAQKNKDITSSIEYAKRIQQAILPPLDEIKKYLPHSFVLYMPKDIVSGDFYWFGEYGDKLILVAADCTGHGVPGALMSMIGHNLLNQIVLEKGITRPATVLNTLNTMVQTALKQGVSNIDTTDGMDMALCCFNKKTNELEYAGANRPLIIVGREGITKLDPDKMPIGGSQISLERNFTNQSHILKDGEVLYIFSDGYADQFGGNKGKKFMMRKFLETLSQMRELPVKEQEKFLYDTIVQWQGENEQVDDILVIGIKATG